MKKIALIISAACVMLTAHQARAVYIMTVAEVGPNVVITGSGSINLNGLIELSTTGGAGEIVPKLADVAVGITTAPAVLYQGVIGGPNNFGIGDVRTATSSTGDYTILLGTVANKPLVALPANYVSGTPLSGTAFFANVSFATLGFTPGTYRYTLAAGLNAESIIVTSVVPEPSTWALLGVGAAATGLVLLHRQRTC